MDVHDLVQRALEEDGAGRDLTTLTTVTDGARARGAFVAKQELVVAGLQAAWAAFRILDPGAVWESEGADGQRFYPGTIVASVSGRARALLSAERVALNFLQRLSGVATLTRRFVDVVAGTKAVIRDTRKTTPLLRALEKEAVRAGGGSPHRSGLDAAILIKDNHVRLAGSVRQATLRALAGADGAAVEVEVERLEQIDEAIGAGARMILLDNFTPEAVREAVARVAGRVAIEVSGGVRLENVRAYAEAGVDYIAVGALTHSAPAMDVSLELEPI